MSDLYRAEEAMTLAPPYTPQGIIGVGEHSRLNLWWCPPGSSYLVVNRLAQAGALDGPRLVPEFP